MTKRKQRFLSYLMILVCLLCSCGSSSSAEKKTPTDSSFQTAAESASAFSDRLSAVDGADNLFQLQSDSLSAKQYNSIERLGDRLLFSACEYPDLPAFSGDADFADSAAVWTFDLYDPDSDRIIASLNTKDMEVSSYQIKNDRLIFQDYADNRLFLYDSDLKQVCCCDSAMLSVKYSLDFYATASPDTFLINQISDSCPIRITFTENDYSVTSCDLDGYDVQMWCTSRDNRFLLLSCVDRQTLHKTLKIMDTDSMETIFEENELGYEKDISSDCLLTKAETGSADNYWRIQNFNEKPSFFEIPDDSTLRLWKDDSIMLFHDSLVFETDTNSHVCTACLYSKNGQCLSSFSYNCIRDGVDRFLSGEPVYLEKYDKAFLLFIANDDTRTLLVWDPARAGISQDPLEFYSSISGIPSSEKEPAEEGEGGSGSEITLIPDIQNYDWGNLSDINERATRLEEAYGISIYLGAEVPKKIDVYDTAQCTDHDILDRVMTSFERILECYPKNFFSQLGYGEINCFRFYLCGDITSSDASMVQSAAGFVTTIDNAQIMCLNSNEEFNFPYTVNHELSHMIDRKLEYRSGFVSNALFSEDRWRSLNPEGVEYLERYDNYMENQQYYDYSEYFFDEYGLTYPTEDRAQLFGAAMSYYLDETAYTFVFENSPKRLAKLRYYCECIRDGFDTTGWSKTMPWEKVLTQF